MILLNCPNCGERNVAEFRFGGEYKNRPQNPEDAASDAAWVDYLYFKNNKLGVQQEWWYHRAGCGFRVAGGIYCVARRIRVGAVSCRQ